MKAENRKDEEKNKIGRKRKAEERREK